MKEENGYTTTRIPQELAYEIDKLLGTKGFRTRAEVVKEALRRLLLDYSKEPILEHFNLDENGIRIVDHSLITQNSPNGRIIDVYFKQEKVWCDHCQSDNCNHVQFALNLPKVQTILKKKGWKIN